MMGTFSRRAIAGFALAALAGCANDGSGLFGTGLFADKDHNRSTVASSRGYENDRPGISPAQRGVETPSYGGMARSPEPAVDRTASTTDRSAMTGDSTASTQTRSTAAPATGATTGGALGGTTGRDTTGFENPTPRPARSSRG